MEFIDISKWNGVFNWQKSVNQGVKGAWLKASGCGVGGNYEDYRFKENSKSCPLLYKGAYQYFDYEARKSGADQCKFFLDTVGSFGNMRGVLEIEDNVGGGWTRLSTVMSKAMKEALAWVNQYYLECNHWPVLYLNTGFTVLQQWTSTGYKTVFRNFIQCPLWVARYDPVSNPLVIGTQKSAWTDYAAWQWTSGGDGLAYGNSPGNVAIDLNRIRHIDQLLKPNAVITIEDPVIVHPVVIEPTTIEGRVLKLEKDVSTLMSAYKNYTK